MNLDTLSYWGQYWILKTLVSLPQTWDNTGFSKHWSLSPRHGTILDSQDIGLSPPDMGQYRILKTLVSLPRAWDNNAFSKHLSLSPRHPFNSYLFKGRNGQQKFFPVHVCIILCKTTKSKQVNFIKHIKFYLISFGKEPK